MKPNRKNLFLTAIITVALSAPSAHATPLYWDTNGTGVSDSGAATGTWGTDAFWSTDPTGNNVGPVTLTATTTSADDLFFSAGTTGTGGTVTLSANQAANSLTFEEGAVTLSGNTINLATGGITVATGAGNAIIGSALTASGARTYDVGTGRILTLNGIVTSTITKNGSGTMTLGTGAVHVIGGWTVNGGTLNLGLSGTGDNLPGGIVNSGGTVKLNGGNSKVNNSGTFTINAGGTFDINGSTDLVGGMIGAGSIINSAAGAANVHTNPNGGTRTFSGVVGGGGGGLMGFILNGNGTQVLSGLNTYAGVTDIRNGSLSINTIKNVGVNSAIGAPALAQATILFGSTTSTGTLVYTGTGDETDRVIRLNGTTGGGTITQSGASGLLKFTSNLSVPGAATDQRKTLTLNGSTAGTGEISGIIIDAVAGTAGQLAISLTKAGTGAWALSGANTYTGATLISGGTLQIGNGIGSTGSIAAASAITNNATLRINRGGALTMANAISGTGTLVKDFATGDLILSGNNSYSGGTSVNAGRLFISAANSLPTTGNVTVANGATLAFNAAGTYNQSISLADGAKLNVRPGGTTLGSVTLPTAGSVIFNSDDVATSAFSLSSNVALTGNLTVQVGGVHATVGAVTLGGNFSGGFGLTKTQIGTLTLSGVSTYTGDTLINNGTLALTSTGGLTFEIGASGTNNKISGAGAGTVSLDGMFTFDLTSAGTTVNDMWNIVDIANLTESYGSNFAVVGFSNIGGGLWNKDNAGTIYQFSTGTGVLTVIPEPNVAALIGALGGILLLRRRR